MLKRKREDQDNGTAIRSTAGSSRILSLEDYTVGWICAIPLEMAAARIMLDDIFSDLPNPPNDSNNYIFGSIGAHNVVIACLPSGVYGSTSAAIVASQMRSSFPSIRFYLMVGIGGGVPSKTTDIRLGDIVVSKPTGKHPGVIQYDFGKTIGGGRFERIGALNKPPLELLTAVSKLQAKHIVEQNQISSLLAKAMIRYPEAVTKFKIPDTDVLFEAEYHHAGGHACDNCDVKQIVIRPPRKTNDPMVHYGLIASGNQVMKDGRTRDQLARELDVYCFEMEAAGLMDFDILVVRGICDYSDSHKNKSWQGYAAATAAAYAKELLAVIPDNKHTYAGNYQEDQRKLCLQSLSYQNIDARLHNISEAHESTCDWFFKTTPFSKWCNRIDVEDYNGVLWIKGKPGAGKSTLMKHSLLYCEEMFPSHCIAAYFFNARGTHLEKSSFGMFRSLLYQLLDKDLESCKRFIPLFLDKQKKHAKSWEWHPGELRRFLLETVRHQKLPTILFVDALDECERTEVRNVVAFLEDLSSVALASGTVLNICLSSRHYPTISMKKMLELVVERQLEHNEDIAIYVGDKLSLTDSDIEQEILRKAQGIFMWVVLVVQILNQAFDEGRIQAVQRKLREVPSGLDEVFRVLLENDNPHMEETILILQWVLFARRRLNAQELYYAIISGTDPGSLGPWDPKKITEKTIHRFIISTSRGLVELRKGDPDTAQFIHETVNDFLLRNKRLQTLDPTLTPHVAGNCHDRLVSCCLSYLEMEELETSFILKADAETGLDDDQKEAKTAALEQRYPFISYAVFYLFDHGELAQSGCVSQRALFQKLRDKPELFRRLKAVHDFLTISPEQRYGPTTSLLHIICISYCPVLIKSLLQESYIDVNAKGGYYFTALQAAVATSVFREGATEELVQILVEAGADVNAQGGYYGTALQAAAAKSHRWGSYHNIAIRISIIHMLLKAGADINLQCGYYGTALQAAAVAAASRYKSKDGKNHAVIRSLLEAGADINAQCGYYGTALQAALSIGIRWPNLETDDYFPFCSVETIKLLLNAGADPNGQDGRYGTVLGAAILNLAWLAFASDEARDAANATITLLLEQGADITAQREDWAWILLKIIYALHLNVKNELPDPRLRGWALEDIVYRMQKDILDALSVACIKTHAKATPGSITDILITVGNEWLNQDKQGNRHCESISVLFELLQVHGAFASFGAKIPEYISILNEIHFSLELFH